MLPKDRTDMAEAVKYLTRHVKEPRSAHMQSIPGEKQEMRVDVLHDKRWKQRCRCMWALIGLEICREERAQKGVIVRRGKHI